MTHFWIVEFLHAEGWTPYTLHLSRQDARDKAARDRNRWSGKWKFRVSRAMRVADRESEI